MPSIPGSKAAYYDDPTPQDSPEDFGKRQAEKIRAAMADPSIRVLPQWITPEEMQRLNGTGLNQLELSFGRDVRSSLDAIWAKNVTKRD